MELRRRGRSWRDIRGGIAIEFRDGCDAFFFFPGSALPQGIAHNADTLAGQIADEFERLDQARGQVLNGLRHHAAQAKAALERSKDGLWAVQLGILSSNIDVGPNLTRLVQVHPPAEALRKLLRQTLLKTPSARKASQLVSLAEPPAEEAVWKDDEPGADVGLACLGIDCSVLDDPDLKNKSPRQRAEAVLRHRNAPGLEVTRGLINRFGKDRFFTDIGRKGSADLSFTDGLASFSVVPRGKRMTKLIAERGIEGSIENLAAEFARLDRARSRFLKALKTLMASRGLAQDVAAINQTWWFGKTHREVQFDPGRTLTLKLRKRGEAEVLAEWLTKHRPFEPAATASEIATALDGSPQEPVRRSLPLQSPGLQPVLPTLEQLDMPGLDPLAANLIDEWKRHAEAEGDEQFRHGRDPLRSWSDPRWYRRGQDQWVDESWWINLARRAWRSHQHQASALILLVNGDDGPRPTLLEQFRQFECYNPEYIDAGLAWFLRSELPWPIDSGGEYPTFPSVLGSPPPELARWLALRVRAKLEAAPLPGEDSGRDALYALEGAAALDTVSATEWLEPAEIEKLRNACRRWAATTNDYYLFWNEYPLQAAANFGWSEIVDILDRNPALVPALLQWDTTRWMIGSFAQRLTLIKPGSLAARFAAYAMTMNLDTEVEATLKALLPALGMKMSSEQIASTRSGYLQGLRFQQFAGAVAWTRCRPLSS
jgi:hypothetical protein